MRGGCWGLRRSLPGSPPLTLPGTRSKSPPHVRRRTRPPSLLAYVNAGTLVDEIRRPAALAAPSDLSLATHLRLVDPAPRSRPGAERGCCPVGVVARGRCVRTPMRMSRGFSVLGSGFCYYSGGASPYS